MKKHYLLVIILGFALLTRLYRLGIPDKYYFDEVYHAVTAKAYARNDPAGYEWWHQAPEPGTAYEWLHPPVAKLLMASGIKMFGQSAWAWRFPGAIVGVGVIGLIYVLGRLVTKKESVGLMAAGLASLDGLLLAQSRIGMNDIYVTFFILAAVIGYVKAEQNNSHRWLWISGIMTGLAVSSKWSGIFLWLMIGVWELWRWGQEGARWWTRVPRLIVTFMILPAIIYVLSYSQFWLQGHSLSQFKELHQQIWWYQTNLKATHTYQSKAWEWPLMLRPVWYFVDYSKNGLVANIYDLGNPLLMWFGLISQIVLIIGSLYQLVVGKLKQKMPANGSALIWTVGYFASWTPWLLSPRIMFFYHYAPAIPFLALSLANACEQWWHEGIAGKIIVVALTISVATMFGWLWPIWVGIPLTQTGVQLRFLLPSWK